MNRSSRLPKVFLHLATLVLLLNASVGYGACCFTILDQTALTGTVAEEVASEQQLPPCHRKAKSSASNISNSVSTQLPDKSFDETTSADTCCLISLAMVPTLTISQAPTNLKAALQIGSTSSLLSGTLTPLLRPPIS